MKSKKYSTRPMAPGATLEARVKSAVPMIWADIRADVDWPCSLDEAVELCIDAGRPVMFGYLSQEDYDALVDLDKETVDNWAREALRCYF